jgi:hypothetical protein
MESHMFYLVIHMIGRNGEEVRVYDRDGKACRAEFSTRQDAEMARAIAIKYNSHSALAGVCIESV